MIKCLIISNLHDDQLRLICLQKELTLDQLLEKAQKREDAMAMNEVMHKKGGDEEKLNRVKQRQPFKDSRQQKEEVRQKRRLRKSGDEQSLRCGNHQHKTRGECPDLREAYHQFEVTTESRKITTFYGPDGLYRYKRLNYGTKSAQDILQNEMRSILAGIPTKLTSPTTF